MNRLDFIRKTHPAEVMAKLLCVFEAIVANVDDEAKRNDLIHLFAEMTHELMIGLGGTSTEARRAAITGIEEEIRLHVEEQRELYKIATKRDNAQNN